MQTVSACPAVFSHEQSSVSISQMEAQTSAQTGGEIKEAHG